MYGQCHGLGRGALQLTGANPDLRGTGHGCETRAMRRLALLPLLVLTAAAPGDDRSFMVSGFDRVRVDGSYDVRVVTGASFSAVATGDADALRRLNLRVEGGTLIVATGADALGARSASGSAIVVRVSVPTPLRTALVNGGGRLTIDRMKSQRVELGVNGGGTMRVEGIDSGEVAATLTGAGSLAATGKSGRATFSSYGTGSVDASGLEVNDLTVRSNGSGSGSFAARYTARISALGLGAVSVTGAPKCTISGTAPVTCGEAQP